MSATALGTNSPIDDLDRRPKNPETRFTLGDIDASPTPYHAVARTAQVLTEAGFAEIDPSEGFRSKPGPYFLKNGGSLVAWIQRATHSGFTIVGAHTDSPNLRVKSIPDVTSAGIAQLGVETYGGVLLNSWLDRGLGLAGRVAIRTAKGATETRLVLDDRPLLLVPQLAIHLDRQISKEGLLLNPQNHMSPMWALSPDRNPDSGHHMASGGEVAPEGLLRTHLAELLDIDAKAVLTWELMAFDTQPAEVVGLKGEFFSTARIDNLLSTFAAARALKSWESFDTPETPVLALYDHEEIGSESATGAAGTFLANILERIAGAQSATRSDFLASMHRSLVVSADGAHATHPNYPDKHEPEHTIALNGGIAIKRNANHRYASDAPGEAHVLSVCEDMSIPVQWYNHRTDLPCGSTIGPLTAARLGVTTVDIGAPQLAMHSCRETAGVKDVEHLTDALRAVWAHRLGV